MIDRESENVDFEALIRASQEEAQSRPAEQLDVPAEQRPEPLSRNPGIVVTAWIGTLLVGALCLSHPELDNDGIGQRVAAVRLGVALYHVAHRVETYRRFTGSLPTYLEPEWAESERVEYEVVDGRYTLLAHAGDSVVRYREGQDPERLLRVVRDDEESDLD